MMQNLRRNTRLILFIVLAAFALLIFFQWGLDITGIKTGEETDVAKIDGTPVPYTQYLRYAQSMENERRGISRDEIWQSMIEEIVWNNLAKKEKIRITDDEIWQIIRSNPPRQLYESEYMKNEKGEFDYNKYLELLKSPESRQWLLEYEFNLRRELPKEKIRSLITTMGWSSPFEDSIIMAKQTTIYDISFISVLLFRLRGLLSISDEELIDFYNKNKKEFISPESKILKYVFFEKRPSNQDTTEARERLEDFIIRVREGEDFLTVAKEVSDDTVIQISFKDENEIPPYQAAVFKKLKNGEISEIFLSPMGFEVIKRVNKNLFYSVKTKIEVSPTTIGEIYDRITSFKETAEILGFDSTAREFNLTVHRTLPLSPERSGFPVRNQDALKKIITKTKNKKEIFGPFSSIGGYYLFVLDSIIPQKVLDPINNKQVIQARYERTKLKEFAREYLNALYNQLALGKTLEQLAAVDTILSFQNDIKGMSLAQIESRYGQEFAGVVGQLEQGQISKPLVTDWAGYIIRCDKKISIPFDTTMVSYLQMARQMRLQYLSQKIFTPKKVIDNRDKFFE